MSDERDVSEWGPLDPELAEWFLAGPVGPMPAEVWARIEAALAAEPPFQPAIPDGADGAGNVIDLGAERQRRSLAARAWPIMGAAAAVVLIGVVVIPVIRGGGGSQPVPVVAGGVAAESPAQPVARSQDPGGADSAVAPEPADSPPVTVTAPQTPSPSQIASSPSTQRATVMPAALMATGTDYTAEAITDQVGTLLTNAGMDQATDVRAYDPSTAPTPTPLGTTGFTATAADLADCLGRLGAAPETPPLVVDRATYDGHDVAVVVMMKAAQAIGAAPVLDVIVVNSACSDEDVAAAEHYDFALAN